jgi:uncharacterized protein (TIGR03435 family)
MKALNFWLLAAFMVTLVQAQNPTPSFEVASIKPNNSRPQGLGGALGCYGTDSNSPGTTIPTGRCIARLQPVSRVIGLAYDIPPASMYPYEGQVLSGPGWINSEMYDIEAKAEGPATQAQLKQMLQVLLAERFKLKLHRENRDMPVYALVTAKNGPKLKAASKDRDCAGQRRRDHRYELSATSLTGHCHAFIPGGMEFMITGQSVDMSDFAEMLSIWAGRLVIDKTGVEGLFDINLPRFLPPGQSLPAVPPNAVEGIREKIAEIQSLPTLFNVLDQLGLKLEAARGPVEVLVIDSIERPSEN